MKLLFLFFPIFAYAMKCPKNVDSTLATCKPIECFRDDSRMLNIVFGAKENFITNISIKKKGNECHVQYKSEWTGSQECKFPMKHLKEVSSMMGDSSSSEALEMFVVMMKLSKAKNKKEFEAAKRQLSGYQNKMMAKQIEVRKFLDENPKLASKINNLCKVDKTKGNPEKVKKYDGYMKRMSDAMTKIQKKIQEKVAKFGS